MENEVRTSLWDRLGILISGFCAVHCLLFPVAIALLPLWPSAYSIHDWTHPLLFLFIVPTVFFALRSKGTDFRIPVLLYSGLMVVGLAWLLHSWIGIVGEAVVTLSGSSLLVWGHWFNYKKHRDYHKARLDHETA